MNPSSLVRQVSLAAIVLATFSFSTARADEQVKDVLGQQVTFRPPPSERATVLFFMSERCREASSSFSQAVDEKLLNAPFESVAIVDVRKYASVKRLAEWKLRSSAREVLEHRRQRRVDRGVDSSPEMVRRWHLIGDFDGKLLEKFGVPREPSQPLAIVLDKNGTSHGPFYDVASLIAALELEISGRANR